MAIYNGFSTLGTGKKYHLTDFELVKQDFYNHLHIRPGEKLNNPKFGCIVWGLLFEQLTPNVKDVIVANLTDIVNADPRIAVDNIGVTEYMNGLMIQMEVRYLLTNEVSRMQVAFDRGAT